MDQINARGEPAITRLGHENVVPIGGHMVLAGVVVALPIDDDLDPGNGVQVVGEALSAVAGVALDVFGDRDMASGDGDLHDRNPFIDCLMIRVRGSGPILPVVRQGA